MNVVKVGQVSHDDFDTAALKLLRDILVSVDQSPYRHARIQKVPHNLLS